MKSNKAKLLHEVGGKAIIMRGIETAEKLGDRRPVLVVGHQADALRAAVGERAQFVTQAEQLGTGHAIMQPTPAPKGQTDIVLLFNADLPLLRTHTLQHL